MSHALLMIDVQKGFLDTVYWGPRNNPELESDLARLLKAYRAKGLPIIHIQHVSTEKLSPLRPGQEGVEFMDGLGPRLGERHFQKSVHSAFIGTDLERYLRAQGISGLLLAGLTTDHCVSTTARMAHDLGFRVHLTEDTTATFDRRGRDGAIPADLVHAVSLASLEGEFAALVALEELLHDAGVGFGEK